MRIYNYTTFLLETIGKTPEQAKAIIRAKCEEKGYEFRGFVTDWYEKRKDTRLILYCPKHKHEWETSTFHNFTRDKSKCEYCSRESSSELQMMPEQEALDKINKKCKEKGYEFKGFVNNKWLGKKTLLILYCPKHNHTWNTTIFESFMIGRGCPICGNETIGNLKRFSEEHATELIKNKCKDRNYEFLGYVGGKYLDNTTKLILFCPKPNHGKWFGTSSNHFLRGVGCPICNESKGALEIAKKLIELGFVELKKDTQKQSNIKYFIREYMFDDCKSMEKEGKRSRKLPFDFYLPEYNLCIEFDGRQHYEPAFGQIKFDILKENDQIKNNYCTGINGRPKLIRISYKEYKNIEAILRKELNSE